MNILPQAWSGGRKIETYTYNDRQVQRIATLAVGVGFLLGLLVALLLHVPVAR